MLKGQTCVVLLICDAYLALGSPHRLQPHHVIPSQKLHASILYVHAYKPQAMLGEGLDIPTIHSRLEDMEPDNQIWQTGLFNGTAAQELATYLGSQQVAPKYLNRLFMLRSSNFPYFINLLDGQTFYAFRGGNTMRQEHRWLEKKGLGTSLTTVIVHHWIGLSASLPITKLVSLLSLTRKSVSCISFRHSLWHQRTVSHWAFIYLTGWHSGHTQTSRWSASVCSPEPLDVTPDFARAHPHTGCLGSSPENHWWDHGAMGMKFWADDGRPEWPVAMWCVSDHCASSHSHIIC